MNAWRRDWHERLWYEKHWVLGSFVSEVCVGSGPDFIGVFGSSRRVLTPTIASP